MHSCSSYISYVRSSRLTTKDSNVLLLLVSPNESRDIGKQLEILHLECRVLHSIKARFVALLKEAADLPIKNCRKSTVIHMFSFYPVRQQLLQSLYEVFREFSDLWKPRFLVS